MKVYFAFSIRGGKSDEKVIKTVYETLKEKGFEITTEFNINPKIREKALTDEEIYERDIQALKESDIVLAEVSIPSLGVGYEICLGERLNKKVFCIVKEKVRLSAMIKGNKNLNLIVYKDLKELKNKLSTLFE